MAAHMGTGQYLAAAGEVEWKTPSGVGSAMRRQRREGTNQAGKSAHCSRKIAYFYSLSMSTRACKLAYGPVVTQPKVTHGRKCPRPNDVVLEVFLLYYFSFFLHYY
jgi:hypothetical protein